jgi:cell division ATPase FtsA
LAANETSLQLGRQSIGKRAVALALAAAATLAGCGKPPPIQPEQNALAAAPAEVTRAQFEQWIAPDVEQMEEAVERVLKSANLGPDQVDRVFLTGGTSLIPRIRRLFEERFGAAKIAGGNELTSIAHGLALIGEHADMSAWIS